MRSAPHVDVVLWYGLMFMAIVVAKPEGIAGMWHRRGRAAMRGRRAPSGGSVHGGGLSVASLEARGLHMRFGDRVVLEDISLVFPDRDSPGSWGRTAPARRPASTS